MCDHGNTRSLWVPIPAHLSHTGADRWDTKPVDACIASIVGALNTASVWTVSSCCGHGRGAGRIDLWDGRVLRVFPIGFDPDSTLSGTGMSSPHRLATNLCGFCEEPWADHNEAERISCERDLESEARRG